MKLTRPVVFTVCFSLAVVLAVGAGMLVIDSPGEARKKRLDELRVQDLRGITNALENYRQTHGKLPVTLDQLVQPNEPYYRLHITDPQSKELYEYRLRGGETYELCSQFQSAFCASMDDNASDAFWRHGPGRTCFQIEVRLPVKARQ